MFLRRLYYDLSTGAMLGCTVTGGRAIASDAATEAAGLENWGVIEWKQPYDDIEAAFAEYDADGNPRRVNVSVDISGSEPQPVFAYEPVPESEQSETEDMKAALNLLGVEVE